MTTITFCERQLLINKNTVVDRNKMDLLQNWIAIEGSNTTVEIDESLFTRRKDLQGRGIPQQWVFEGICRETRGCYMYTVPDRSAATLMPMIQNSILPGTTVISDLYRAYGGINAIGFNLTYNRIW